MCLIVLAFVCAPQVLVIAIVTFVADPFMQVYTSAILLVLALVLHAHVFPFTSDNMNVLEMASLSVTLATQVRAKAYTVRRPSQTNLGAPTL